MKRVPFLLLLPFFFFTTSCKENANEPKTLKVMMFNIWQEGTKVPGGFDAIIDEIVRADADLVTLSEVRNYNDTSLDERLVAALKSKGKTYYAKRSQDSGLLSRYPIKQQEALFPVKDDRGSITKALIEMEGKEIVLYSAHLDYRNCSLYLPRGYDGSTWQELPQPITDIDSLLADNAKSQRDEAIQAFLADAKQEQQKGRIVILGGDFNEPSHLDWTAATKDLYDHNGVVIQWPNTLALEQAGFVDAYREKYPNPLTHPGFTFPADNPLVDLKELAWSPKADDRDRIDFIFYPRQAPLVLKDITIVGPRGSIANNKRIVETSDDPFLLPLANWPTDHKALLATFKWN